MHALYCDHHELWVGTYAHGVYRLNSATGKVTNYSDKNIKGLNPGSVYAIYKDSSGRLWFGTQTGILYYDIFSNSFVTIADLGYNSYITDITEDANHTIWFASQGKGLISYDLKTSTLKFHSNDQTGLPQSIVCLCSDQGKLRIGTGGYGLYTYNPADHSFTRHPDPLFRTHTTIQTIISSYNELWIHDQCRFTPVQYFRRNHQLLQSGRRTRLPSVYQPGRPANFRWTDLYRRQQWVQCLPSAKYPQE